MWEGASGLVEQPLRLKWKDHERVEVVTIHEEDSPSVKLSDRYLSRRLTRGKEAVLHEERPAMDVYEPWQQGEDLCFEKCELVNMGFKLAKGH